MKRILIFMAMAATAFITACSGGKEQDSSAAALEVIMSRTSIRSFTGDPVSKEQLEVILKAGMAAPTAMNSQPWRFVVITDKARIEELFCNGPRSGMFKTAGAVIVVCGQTTAMRKPFGQPDAPEVEMENIFWFEDCSAATQNILLAVNALGLGAVWTAGYPAMERVASVAEALGLPEKVVPLCVIPIGVPAETPAPKDKWNPSNIHWEQW